MPLRSTWSVAKFTQGVIKYNSQVMFEDNILAAGEGCLCDPKTLVQRQISYHKAFIVRRSTEAETNTKLTKTNYQY